MSAYFILQILNTRVIWIVAGVLMETISDIGKSQYYSKRLETYILNLPHQF